MIQSLFPLGTLHIELFETLGRSHSSVAISSRQRTQHTHAPYYRGGKSLLATDVGHQHRVFRRKQLVGAVHTAKLLHSLFRRPRQLHNDHMPRTNLDTSRLASPISMQRDPRTGGVRNNSYVLAPVLKRLLLFVISSRPTVLDKPASACSPPPALATPRQLCHSFWAAQLLQQVIQRVGRQPDGVDQGRPVRLLFPFKSLRHHALQNQRRPVCGPVRCCTPRFAG
mmetsp:Transcript_76374/g.174952  ORF Transcript_76374/g.174952 Transcript_76374/m.174952 type:complete len:225 (-) Transcript_76374:416-1090(-)